MCKGRWAGWTILLGVSLGTLVLAGCEPDEHGDFWFTVHGTVRDLESGSELAEVDVALGQVLGDSTYWHQEMITDSTGVYSVGSLGDLHESFLGRFVCAGYDTLEVLLIEVASRERTLVYNYDPNLVPAD